MAEAAATMLIEAYKDVGNDVVTVLVNECSVMTIATLL